MMTSLTGSSNTVSPTQLKAMKLVAKPSANAVAQITAAGKTPITATGALSAKTSANAVSKIDGSAFAQGAQINNESNSSVQGSTNMQGSARAASTNTVVANYSGANLVNLNKALAGTPATGKSQKGIVAQGISGAMNMLDSDTTNKGGINIKGGNKNLDGPTASTNISNGFGGLGNLTNKTNLTTTGATNSTGDVIGSQNSMTFSGSEYNPNT